MALILFSRVGGNLILFVILARALSVSDFGLFAACFSAAAIAALIVDFGSTQSLLREIGAKQNEAAKYIRTGLRIKYFLLSAVFPIAILLAFIALENVNEILLFGILLVYGLMNSYAEFFGTAMRAYGHYEKESLIQVSHTFIVLAVVVLIWQAGFGSAAALIALGMLLAKLIHLIMIYSAANKLFQLDDETDRRESMGVSLKNGLPYAADAGVTNLLINIDVLIVASFLGRDAAAYYQGGQKLVQGYSSIAMIFSNVYLPLLARAANDKRIKEYSLLSFKVISTMLIVGSTGWVLMYVYPAEIVSIVYGEKYHLLVDLLPIFGVLIFIRLAAAGLGVNLVALKKQKIRVYANLLVLILVVGFAKIAIDSYGVIGMLYLQIAAVSLLLAIYILAFIKFRKVIA